MGYKLAFDPSKSRDALKFACGGSFPRLSWIIANCTVVGQLSIPLSLKVCPQQITAKTRSLSKNGCTDFGTVAFYVRSLTWRLNETFSTSLLKKGWNSLRFNAMKIAKEVGTNLLESALITINIKGKIKVIISSKIYKQKLRWQ